MSADVTIGCTLHIEHSSPQSLSWYKQFILIKKKKILLHIIYISHFAKYRLVDKDLPSILHGLTQSHKLIKYACTLHF